ncbi:MAG TPA: hypothetical protein VGM25_07415 [Caulobacteraceae bacterium]|jgi:hypothetical protein
MSLYMFYLCQPNGDARSFEIFDLHDDVAAFEEAGVMLDQHLSAAHVAVWCDERKVCTVRREERRWDGVASGHRPIRAH